jgi:hypothetical protein
MSNPGNVRISPYMAKVIIKPRSRGVELFLKYLSGPQMQTCAGRGSHDHTQRRDEATSSGMPKATKSWKRQGMIPRKSL